MAVATRLAQHTGFGLVQVLEARRLRRGVSVLPLDRPRDHLTSVVRLPVDLSEALVEAARRLSGAGSHYLYAPTDVHLTVLNLDTRGTAAGRVETAAAAMRGTGTFPVVLRGFGVSRQSIYARAYDPTTSLWRLRGRVAQVVGMRPPLPLRLLGFVNLLRFGHPQVQELIASAAAARGTSPVAGAFHAQCVEIVRTDKVLSREGTELLQRVELSGEGPTG